MNTAKVLEVTEKPKCREQIVCEFKNTVPCPRYMHDVYSLGFNLQYYIGDIHLQLANLNHGDIRQEFKLLSVKQLEVKEKIEDMSRDRLNEMLAIFYNNGGQIIDPTVSEREAKEIQPFFNRLLDSFFQRLEYSIILANNGLSADKLESLINAGIMEMYTNMSKLYRDEEIINAFNQLINLKMTEI